MALNDLFDFDPTVYASNSDVNGSNIAEGCLPSGINNAIRALLGIILRATGYQGANIASAATTAIAAANTGLYAHVTGVVTITALGTVRAGTFRIIEFDGILTLTHNATSLKLPGAANITTAAGDIGFFISLGAGNWKCLSYQPAAQAPLVAPLTLSSTAAGTLLTLTSTDAGAAAGPLFLMDRFSASPAAADNIGGFIVRGRDSGGNATDYGSLAVVIDDPTNGSEDSSWYFNMLVAGASDYWSWTTGGLSYSSAGTKGLGTINTLGSYTKGHGTLAQAVRVTSATYQTCSTDFPCDNTIPQITEGDELFNVSITPTNASSTLLIRFSGFVGSTTASEVGAGLFVDATANALNAVNARSNSAAGCVPMILEHSVSAGSTSARTYRIRLGPDVGGAANAFLNGDNTARKFGGVATASLEVQEILPQ